jgi:hypothetical protein
MVCHGDDGLWSAKSGSQAPILSSWRERFCCD